MRLRDFTMARVQLERAGTAVATSEVLAFQFAHAAARDAVHEPLDTTAFGPGIVVRSQARDRAMYLRRPDLGRRLDVESAGLLVAASHRLDLAIVIADGLSALAVHRHALAVLRHLNPLLDSGQWTCSELVVVEQGRVAIGDDIGQRLNAGIVLVLIGERPGLSSPDSLGAYLTWDPRPGRTDAERNCISNIRPEGLGYEQAAARIFGLLSEARRRQLTGIALKENLLALPELR
jgi:ethanolamine ammonia-lyase small subunit